VREVPTSPHFRSASNAGWYLGATGDAFISSQAPNSTMTILRDSVVYALRKKFPGLAEFLQTGGAKRAMRTARFDTEVFVPNPEIKKLETEIARRRQANGCGGCLTLGLLSAGNKMVVAQLERSLRSLEQSDEPLRNSWEGARSHRRQRFAEVVESFGSGKVDTTTGPTSLSNQLATVQLNDSRPSGATRGTKLATAPGEVLVIEYRASLWAYQDVGFSLDAKLGGRFKGSTSAVSLSSDHFAMTAAGSSGSFAGEISGELNRLEGFRETDQGRLALTTQRVVFIGARRTLEIGYDKILGADGGSFTLDIKWPGQQSKEQFLVCDGDLLARLVLLLKERSHHGDVPTPVARPTPSPLLDSTPPLARVERVCPWCAERILKQARVCKHCSRDVPPSEPG
jgi:hypothetical protein